MFAEPMCTALCNCVIHYIHYISSRKHTAPNITVRENWVWKETSVSSWCWTCVRFDLAVSQPFLHKRVGLATSAETEKWCFRKRSCPLDFLREGVVEHALEHDPMKT